MKSILQKEIGLPIVELSDPNATIDGGDVLFTGRLSQFYSYDASSTIFELFLRSGIFCWTFNKNKHSWSSRTCCCLPRIPMHTCEGDLSLTFIYLCDFNVKLLILG